MFGCSDVLPLDGAALRTRSACRTADVLALESHSLDATILGPRPKISATLQAASALQFTQNLIINGDNSTDDTRCVGCHQLRAPTHPTKYLCENTALASHGELPVGAVLARINREVGYQPSVLAELGFEL